MNETRAWIAIGTLVALVPFASADAARVRSSAEAFPGWATVIDTSETLTRYRRSEPLELSAVAMSEREREFARAFPGRIGKFRTSHDEYVLRYVERPTRMLHPAGDCFAAIGYDVGLRPLHIDAEAHLWGAFSASRGEEQLLVHERIEDSAGSSWTDISSWYWAAALGRSSGPWLAITRVSR